MTDYQSGDVVLLRYLFTNAEGAKKRPALVLRDTGDDDVILARVTSQVSRRDPFDVELTHWAQAGLVVRSVARVHKVLTAEKGLIERRLGSLTSDDWTQVQAAIRRLWAL